MRRTAGELAALVGGAIFGDPETPVSGVNGIREAVAGQVTFVRGGRYRDFLATTRASAVILAEPAPEFAGVQIVVPQPDAAFFQVLQLFYEDQSQHPKNIHPTAVIDASAQIGQNVAMDAYVRVAPGAVIGEGCVLYAGVYIGSNARLGAGCLLYPHAVVREDCEIGARCILHAHATIGSDGFGFAPVGGHWLKIPQLGRVILGDDVEVGSNSAIDRATFGVTRVGQGTKIDNLVQIGHNVEIGEHCVIAAEVGIAGSAVIGSHVRIGAQSGIAGHLEVGDGVTIGARGGVTHSIPPGATVSGFPAIDHNEERRVMVATTKLPELIRRVRRLERLLESAKDDRHG